MRFRAGSYAIPSGFLAVTAARIGVAIERAMRGGLPAGAREGLELLFIEVQIDMTHALDLPQLTHEPVARRAVAQLYVVGDLEPPAVVAQRPRVDHLVGPAKAAQQGDVGRDLVA